MLAMRHQSYRADTLAGSAGNASTWATTVPSLDRNHRRTAASNRRQRDSVATSDVQEAVRLSTTDNDVDHCVAIHAGAMAPGQREAQAMGSSGRLRGAVVSLRAPVPPKEGLKCQPGALSAER